MSSRANTPIQASEKSNGRHVVDICDGQSTVKRLQSELMALAMSPPVGISAFPDGGDLFSWTSTIQGSAETVFEGFTFKLRLKFPTNYPYQAPNVKFDTFCFHPNVDQYGNVCLDILKEQWSAVYNVKTILLSLQSLLSDPNVESPLNMYAAQLWSNQEMYKKFVELEAFKCFHFRHRSVPIIGTLADPEIPSRQRSMFCLVEVEPKYDTLFIKQYSNGSWMDRKGNRRGIPVFILKVPLDDENVSKTVENNSELHPARALPRGNVGTPLRTIKDMIRRCILPSRVARDLGVSSVFHRKGRCIPFKYNDDIEAKHINKEYNEDENFEQDAEEWERHEALHECDDKKYEKADRMEADDLLYEENIELQWEKGGPGVVFYTDSYYWDSKKGDFLERTVDDFDVSNNRYDDNENQTVRTEEHYQKYRKQGVATTMMQRMGYQEGQGMGKKEDGILGPIEHSGQQSRAGIGYIPRKKRKTRKKSSFR